MAAKSTVLIVDDEPAIGDLLKLFLEDDFEVTTFTDPRVACEEITKKPYDVVISDIRMPYLSGLDVTKHVKTVRPGVFVVLITGHAQTAADKEEALGMGASGVLFKPFGDPAKIIEYIQNLLAGPAYTPASAPVAAPSPVAAPVVAKAAKAGKPKVLAMDDDSGIIEILQILLEDDFDLRAFTDPVEAIACIANEKFDVILTDLNMPQMSGKEAIVKIRSLNGTIPIMVMTGHGRDEPEAKEALAAGGNEVLEKPFASVEVLVAQIGKLLK